MKGIFNPFRYLFKNSPLRKKNRWRLREAFSKGVFNPFQEYHFGKHKDNNTRREYGYRPYNKGYVKGECAFGYTNFPVNVGKVAKITSRGEAIKAYKRRSHKYKTGDKIIKAYGSIIPFDDGSQGVTVHSSQEVYLDKKGKDYFVCRNDGRQPQKMGLRRYLYGKKDNSKEHEHGYDGLANAETGKQVFGYTYGSVRAGEETEILSREEALKLYEDDCRGKIKPYEIGDCLTKVYGQVMKKPESGSKWIVRADHTNQVYLDLKDDHYDFRSKKIEIEPRTEPVVETETEKVGEKKVDAEKETAPYDEHDFVLQHNKEMKEPETEKVGLSSDERQKFGLEEQVREMEIEIGQGGEREVAGPEKLEASDGLMNEYAFDKKGSYKEEEIGRGEEPINEYSFDQRGGIEQEQEDDIDLSP